MKDKIKKFTWPIIATLVMFIILIYLILVTHRSFIDLRSRYDKTEPQIGSVEDLQSDLDRHLLILQIEKERVEKLYEGITNQEEYIRKIRVILKEYKENEPVESD